MTDDAAINACRETVFHAAGDGWNADGNVLWLEIQELVDEMKVVVTGGWEGRGKSSVLPSTTIGNGFEVIDARAFVPTARPYPYRPFGQVQRISVHHSVTREPQTEEDELRLLEEIGAYHIAGNGWPAFAYHFATAPSGRLYYCGDLETLRYTVGPDNPYNVANCVMGNFTDHSPTGAALESLRLWIGEIQFTRGLAIDYMSHGHTPGTAPTACCGATQDEWLPGLAG